MITITKSKINIIFNKPSNWLQWFFIIQDTAKTNKVWEYINLAIKKDNFPKLEILKRPIPKDILLTAILIAQLNQH